MLVGGYPNYAMCWQWMEGTCFRLRDLRFDITFPLPLYDQRVLTTNATQLECSPTSNEADAAVIVSQHLLNKVASEATRDADD